MKPGSLQELINETLEACGGEVCGDLAVEPRDAAKLVIGAKTRNLASLENFKGLDRVCLIGLDQSTFDAVLAAIAPRSLAIWDLKAADLSALARLTRLERLAIVGARQVADISALGQLRRLWLLSLERMPKARDLSALAALDGLEQLCFAGGHGTSPKRVPSLRPLAGLKALQRINLRGVTAKDGSLSPLAGLPALVEIALTNCWPTEEFARLSVLYPDADCEWFAPYVEHSVGIAGFTQEKTVYVTGARKPSFTKPSAADWKEIEAYAEGFRSLQEAFRED